MGENPVSCFPVVNSSSRTTNGIYGHQPAHKQIPETNAITKYPEILSSNHPGSRTPQFHTSPLNHLHIPWPYVRCHLRKWGPSIISNSNLTHANCNSSPRMGLRSLSAAFTLCGVGALSRLLMLPFLLNVLFYFPLIYIHHIGVKIPIYLIYRCL